MTFCLSGPATGRVAEWPTPRYPATLLDELAGPDPLTRRQVQSALRGVGVWPRRSPGCPGDGDTAHALRLLAHWLDPS